MPTCYIVVPIIKTKNPVTMGCPVSPDRVAREWTPTPRAPADKVATIPFNPFPSVAPLKDGK